ncbi:hypothetical protein HDV06_006272, partial [Boothiomyces sp. JEL0866]
MSQIIYLIVLLENDLSGSTLSVTLQVIAEICDIINTCSLEIAYVLRLKAVMGSKWSKWYFHLFYIYPIIYPATDILGIIGISNQDVANISQTIYNIAQIGLVVQEVAVHTLFFLEIVKKFRIGKHITESLVFTVLLQAVYIFGFLGVFICFLLNVDFIPFDT